MELRCFVYVAAKEASLYTIINFLIIHSLIIIFMEFYLMKCNHSAAWKVKNSQLQNKDNPNVLIRLLYLNSLLIRYVDKQNTQIIDSVGR